MPRASEATAASASPADCVKRACAWAPRECAKPSATAIAVGIPPTVSGHHRLESSKANRAKPVESALLRLAADKAWTTDITYLETDEGWLYLAAIVDLGTRRIVGWGMSERMSAKLVCDALQMAYWRRRPAAGLLMHSDRGSQYASEDYRKLLKQFHMTQSMSRKGNCWDNAPMESFFKTLKVEHTYRLRYTSREQARLDVVNWTEGFYNEKRMHSAIDYRSPADFERSLKAA